MLQKDEYYETANKFLRMNYETEPVPKITTEAQRYKHTHFLHSISHSHLTAEIAMSK